MKDNDFRDTSNIVLFLLPINSNPNDRSTEYASRSFVDSRAVGWHFDTALGLQIAEKAVVVDFCRFSSTTTQQEVGLLARLFVHVRI